MAEHVFEKELKFGLRNNWYENDLQLAAELGKNLLERNQDLELQLQQAFAQQDEQKMEIDLLQKQLEILKSVNDSRMRMYEDVDRNAQELEKLNAQLLKDKKIDRDYISNLKETVKKLEEKNLELDEMVEENAAKFYNSFIPDIIKRRVNSVPSLLDEPQIDLSKRDWQMPGPWRREKEAEELRKLINRQEQTVKRLEMQVVIEKNRRKLLESELGAAFNAHVALEEKFRDELEKMKAMQQPKNHRDSSVCDDDDGDEGAHTTKQNDNTANKKSPRPSHLKTTSLASANNEMKVEHDLDRLPRGKVVRLKNGGSAYGSRESLNMMGLEVLEEDATPSVEVCSTILASDMARRAFETKDREERDAARFCLLGELEEQYQMLVSRYESLIESKQKSNQTDRSTQYNVEGSMSTSTSTTTTSGNTSMVRSLDLTSPLDPTEGRFDHGPPEYKRLFKEIFQTLRKSRVYDEETI
ncbi:hypothetical protein HELRODRAFT_193720 [Helobdella robusta]|uniref:Uncharacterized protein n=1 Tax=Helobdella robusta TaxID=6412 RepID=T1FVA5_HELRO|nr:hypothetical protein HELRODRAFT_193720 [Helobdella robusta]ESN95028.1 hypothetical protein HELRODRAFT_193720 [Helobdella robusta]